MSWGKILAKRPGNAILLAVGSLLIFTFLLFRVQRAIRNGPLPLGAGSIMPGQKHVDAINNSTLGVLYRIMISPSVRFTHPNPPVRENIRRRLAQTNRPPR